MSHNTHERIRNLSPVSSISLALLLFYFITNLIYSTSNNGTSSPPQLISNQTLKSFSEH